MAEDDRSDNDDVEYEIENREKRTGKGGGPRPSILVNGVAEASGVEVKTDKVTNRKERI